jgi:hypothetical protein
MTLYGSKLSSLIAVSKIIKKLKKSAVTIVNKARVFGSFESKPSPIFRILYVDMTVATRKNTDSIKFRVKMRVNSVFKLIRFQQ